MAKARSAFTLIELLVVIAIIALLAAILFPVFAQAKAAAKKTTSVSNVKQLVLAQLMYASDNEDAFALVNRLEDGAVGWLPWVYTVHPYTKSFGVGYSPNASIIYQPWYNIKHYGSLPRAATQAQLFYRANDVIRSQLLGVQNAMHDGVLGFGSDGVNAWYAGNTTAPSLTQTSINRVAETALIFDANMFDANYHTFLVEKIGYCVIWTAGAQVWYDMIFAAARYQDGFTDCSSMVGVNNGAPDYGGRINIKRGLITTSYADGHAGAVPPSRFYQLENHPSLAGEKYMKLHMPTL